MNEIAKNRSGSTVFHALRRVMLIAGLTAMLGLILAWTGVDLAISAWCYQGQWRYAKLDWIEFLYLRGPQVSLAIAIAGLVAWLLMLGPLKKWRKFWRQALFLPLMMILGPGLLVNSLFKDQWGRPRPKQLEQFGGTARYLAPGFRDAAAFGRKSFVSGHASMGFYLMAGYFLWRRHRRRWAIASLWLGIFGGLLIGGVRVVQGGHFCTDVLWAGMVVYVCGELLALKLFRQT